MPATYLRRSRPWMAALPALAVAASFSLASPAQAGPPHPTPPAHSHAGGNHKSPHGTGSNAPTHSHAGGGHAPAFSHAGGNGNGPRAGSAGATAPAPHAPVANAPAPRPATAHAPVAAGPTRGSGAAGDPPGNNGTVKIKGLGDLGTIPNNVAHPGCDFQVMWYGFDQGPDVISTVTFTMQAPTRDVRVSVDGDQTVFVGGDPATGAGTATGLDGTQAYHLSFDGAPHPKQGYHVRLTVSTPHSLGNDTKTKVFWVDDCTPAAAPSSTGSTSGAAAGSAGSVDAPFTASAVSGPMDSARVTTGVPTAVDAGAHGPALLRAWHGTLLPLLVVLLGLLAGAAAVVTRRRGHGTATA